MREERKHNFAGDLQKELAEVKKITPQNEDIGLYASTTITCMHFLSIYCC